MTIQEVEIPESISPVVEKEGELDSKSDNSPPSKRYREPSADSNGTEQEFRLTPSESRTEWIQMITLCYSLFVVGWNDGTIGPLIPTYQNVYRIGYTVVSLLFIFNVLGIFLGASIIVLFSNRFGFGKLIAFGNFGSLIAYSILSPATPFPAMVFAYFINGVSFSLIDAQSNGFVTCLRERASLKMGMIHAAYGVGALIAPNVATQFAPLKRWSLFYLVSLGLTGISFVALLVVFRLKHQRDLIARWTDIKQSQGSEADSGEAPFKGSHYKQILRTKEVHLLAVFLVIYVGVEVTTGGWITTFIIRERHGSSTAGYTSAGFFGGIAVGRIILLPISNKVGEYRVIFLYTIIALGLEFTIWFVDSLVENAIAASIIGVLLGPVYPITMSLAGRILAPEIIAGSVGYMSALGAAGSALFSFAAGALASRFGIISMQPLLIILVCCLLIIWFFVPSRRKEERSGTTSPEHPV